MKTEEIIYGEAGEKFRLDMNPGEFRGERFEEKAISGWPTDGRQRSISTIENSRGLRRIPRTRDRRMDTRNSCDCQWEIYGW